MRLKDIIKWERWARPEFQERWISFKHLHFYNFSQQDSHMWGLVKCPRIKDVFQLVLAVLSSVTCAPHGLPRAAVLCGAVILVLAEGALEGSLHLWWCEPSWRMRNKWLGLTVHWFPWLPRHFPTPLCCSWAQCWFKEHFSAQNWCSVSHHWAPPKQNSLLEL